MSRVNDLFQPLQRTTLSLPLGTQTYAVSRRWEDMYRKFKSNKLALFSCGFVLLLVTGAVLIPELSVHTYYENNLSFVNTKPSINFWFGTDELGRDIFVRAWQGARISLGVGIGCAIINLILGIAFGGLAGFLGGCTDEIIMRMIDVLDAVPGLLQAMALRCLFEGGFLSVLIIISLVSWCGTARIVRFQVLHCKQQDFVLAARAIGASKWHIFHFHILPNLWGPLLVSVTLSIPRAIFSEGFLSFLGMGVDLPVASWGSMASSGLSALRYYPWQLCVPAMFIFSTMLSFNWIAEGVNEAFDPRQGHHEGSL